MTTPRAIGHLGEMLVRVGLVTEAQLGEALEDQRARRSYVPLGQILVERGVLSQRRLDALLEDARNRPRLGELLVRKKVITATQLAHALERQRAAGSPLGQVLISLGYATDEKIREALALQVNMRIIARMLDHPNKRPR